MRVEDTILGPARGTAEEAIRFSLFSDADHESEVDSYILELYRLAPMVGLDPAILVSQSAHETRNWTSYWWRLRLNPAGLGITGDPQQNEHSGYWANGTDAARAQIVHMWRYVIVPDTAAYRDSISVLRDFLWLDPRLGEIPDKWVGSVRTIADLTEKWATDPDYHTKIAAKGNLIFTGIPDQEHDMALLIPRFEQRIAPWNIPNRTGLPMASPSKITIHEVGNTGPGATTEMHVLFVWGGGGSNGVSFHFIVGPDKVAQIIELDEACWHASDGYNGPGNRDSIAIETIQIGDFDRTLWHLAWLCAEIITNPGRFAWQGSVPRPYDIDENDHTQHNWWAPDRKHCPQFMRERDLWPVVMHRIDLYLSVARGPAPDPKPPAPVYAARSKPTWLTEQAINSGSNRKIGTTSVFYLGRKWEALRDAPRYRHTAPRAPLVGPPIRPGEHFLAHFVYRSHGEWWVLTDTGTRVKMAHLDQPAWLDLDKLAKD